MKIRTVDQLLEKISQDRVWRIREISALRGQCFSSSTPTYAASALRRSFIPMAYAHWEGFVKLTSHYYLEYVAFQHLTLTDLSPSFRSMYLMQECSKDIATGKSSSLIEVCRRISEPNGGRVWINYKDVISTQSNLNSRVLKDICLALGISYEHFELKEAFINSTLVGQRNHIAHGEQQTASADEIEYIKETVVGLITLFRNEIENSAIEKRFRA